MPTPKPPKDEPTPQADAPTDIPAEAPAPEPEAAPEPPGPKPGVYAYTYFADSVYPHVPLTARAATADAPASIVDWPFGPPDDGRWAPTTKDPNQAADNASPVTAKE
jgi:hypothetical protein